MAPIVYGLGAALAGWFGYKFLTKPRFVGDLAKPGVIASADQVEVTVADLMRSNASAVIGSNPGQIPTGTASVLVAVLGADKNTLQGPIVAFGSVPLPAPLGSVLVPRKDVQKVIRGGKTATNATISSSTQFAGERRPRTFMG